MSGEDETIPALLHPASHPTLLLARQMRQRFLRISTIRRRVVSLAWALVCAANSVQLLGLLLSGRDPDAWVRLLQLALFVSQCYVTLARAFAPQEAEPETSFSACWPNLAPLTTLSSGKGFLLSETLRLAIHVSLSYYPMVDAPLDRHGACVVPNVNPLIQQVVMTAYIAMLGVPLTKVVWSWLYVPFYLLLDWRYAALNGLPGSDTLLSYLLLRGTLLVAAKVFFSGLPALIVTQSSRAQQVAVYAVCLPLLGVQSFVSGWRVFNGIDEAGLWEVWLATVVSFGLGTDVGHVIEELRSQFSKVRSIAVDVLPQHVVDTLMRLPTRNMDGRVDDEGEEVEYEEEEDLGRVVGNELEDVATQEAALTSMASAHAQQLQPLASDGSGEQSAGQQQQGVGLGLALGLAPVLGPAERLLQFAPHSSPQSFEEDLRVTPVRGSASSARSSRSGLAALGLPSRTASGATVVTGTDGLPPGSDLAATAGGGQTLLNFSQPGTPGSNSGRVPGGTVPTGSGSGSAAAGGMPGGVIAAAALALGHHTLGSGSGSGAGLAPGGGGSVSSPGSKSKSRSAELPVLTPQAALRRAPTKRRSALGENPAQAEYAEEHPRACILFADVCNFTTISEGTTPCAIVLMLNRLFGRLDDAVGVNPLLYKLDTVGDCYMVASGLRWHDADPCPARTIVDFAKYILDTAATVQNPVTGEPLQMRVGIHKGPVVGALLGCLRRKYTVLGDVVNAASRLESTSLPGAIHISADLYRHLWRLPTHLAVSGLGADDLPNWGPGSYREHHALGLRDQVLSPCRENSSQGDADASQAGSVRGSHRGRGGAAGAEDPPEEVHGEDVDVQGLMDALRLGRLGTEPHSPCVPSSPSPSGTPVYPMRVGLGPLGAAAAAGGQRGGAGGGRAAAGAAAAGGETAAAAAAGAGAPLAQLGVARSAASAYGVTFESSHSHMEAEAHMLHSLAAQGLLAIGEGQQPQQQQGDGSDRHQQLSSGSTALGSGISTSASAGYAGFGRGSVGSLAAVTAYEGCRSISHAGAQSLSRGRGAAGGGGTGVGPAWDSADGGADEAWQYRGRIELKGRAALETYILQVA